MDQKKYYEELEDKLNDISLYGEFMSTFNYWVSSEEQKNKVQHLQTIGKPKEIKYQHPGDYILQILPSACAEGIFYSIGNPH